MEFALLELGSVGGIHQQFVLHQGFGGGAIADRFKAQHK